MHVQGYFCLFTYIYAQRGTNLIFIIFLLSGQKYGRLTKYAKWYLQLPLCFVLIVQTVLVYLHKERYNLLASVYLFIL